MAQLARRGCSAVSVNSLDSCETHQQNKILRAIRKNLVKRCLEMFAAMAEKMDAYRNFGELVGKCIQLGDYEDSINSATVAEPFRLRAFKMGDGQISLTEYVDHMKERRNDSYYTTGEGMTAALMLDPENMRKKGFEDLHAVGSVDEYAVQQCSEFEN